MLHFIYNQNLVGVLVNHSRKLAEFVLQIPSHPPFDKTTFSNAELKEKIQFITHQPINDVKIQHYGSWVLHGTVASNYFKNSVVLAGDSAHSFPPAGGFGMNTGI